MLSQGRFRGSWAAGSNKDGVWSLKERIFDEIAAVPLLKVSDYGSY